MTINNTYSSIIVGTVLFVEQTNVSIRLESQKTIQLSLFYPPFLMIPKIGSKVKILQIEYQKNIFQYHLLSFSMLENCFFSLEGQNLKRIDFSNTTNQD